MSDLNKKQTSWADELEQTVVNSLVTTFGLDFLLMEDKRGGDVDTILKAREYQKEIKSNGMSNIYLSNETKGMIGSDARNIDSYKKIQYDSNGNIKRDKNGKKIKKDDYHGKSKLYEKRKRNDELKELSGSMIDGYTGKRISADDIKKKNGKNVTELDHVLAASEIHDDLGRIISGLDGVELANSDDNLVSTHWVINNAKNDHSINEFLKKGGVRDKKVVEIKNKVNRNKEALNNPSVSIEEKEKLNKEIYELERKKEILEDLNEEKMSKIEEKARKSYNDKINFEYYTSSKFFSSTVKAAGKQGLAMGARQALGLVFAEIWFELREQIPNIYNKCKSNFSIHKFLKGIADALKNILNRVKNKFSDLLTKFKDGFFAGLFSSLSTTIVNIFLISEKVIVKMIKELWTNIISIVKLLVLNPDNLSWSELIKASLKILTAGLATVFGAMLNANLTSLFVFPMGDLVASFLSALATGLMTLSFAYLIESIWNGFKSKLDLMIEHMREVNATLDKYLLEWAKISFNINPKELTEFADSLELCNSEMERGSVLDKEIKRRNIELPFESGNTESVRSWLMNL